MARPGRRVQQALNMLEEEYWYAGSISERKAEEILTSLGSPGCFLVRDSLFPEADYILSVLGSQEQINHFPVIIGENNSCTLNNYIFDDILTAINFYCENRLMGVFLNLPTTSVVKDTDVPSVSYQPVIRPVQYSKPVMTGPHCLSTPLRGKSFSSNSCSSGGSPIYDTIDPEFGVKVEARNTSVHVQERKVSFDSQDSETYSDGLDSPPLVRYQTENGSIYTLPNCRRGNLQKLMEKTNTIQPSLTPNRKNREEVSSSSNSPSHKIEAAPSIQCKKALFEQFTKPDLLDVRNIGPEPVKLTSDHMKPSLRRMNTIATPSVSLIPPPPPPPRSPRSPAASKLSPLSKGPSNDRVNCKGTLKSMHSEPLLPSSDKQPSWSPHGPTIAVPTAILAGMKQSNKTVPFDEEEFEETLIDQNYYSPRYSAVVEDNAPSMTHYAIPTAILAGIAPPIPMRFESAHCGFLQRPSSIYDSVESLLEVEDGHSKVTYVVNTDEVTSRRGSLTSAISSPALLSGGKGEDNSEGKLRRIKKLFRKK